jgi:hypothetical protein
MEASHHENFGDMINHAMVWPFNAGKLALRGALRSHPNPPEELLELVQKTQIIHYNPEKTRFELRIDGEEADRPYLAEPIPFDEIEELITTMDALIQELIDPYNNPG